MNDETIDIRDDRPAPDETCTCTWSMSPSGHGYVFISDNECPAKPHARRRTPDAQ